ncbi:transposase [Kitasatospora sp. NPDC059811]|uniref:transposase n=1 Tax=Kitasatospora sp. NPDC059811 TaxID=3346957 RepID=UPI003663EFAC
MWGGGGGGGAPPPPPGDADTGPAGCGVRGRGVRRPVSEAGRPGLSPGQLALVSALQFAENLSDRAAANAVRTRIDWKYALGLDLDDPGFDHSVLCEFRARLAEGDAADRLLRVMLRRLVKAGLLKAGGRQHTDATHVLAGVRTQPAGTGGRELAGRTRIARPGGPRLAAAADRAGVGQALRSQG